MNPLHCPRFGPDLFRPGSCVRADWTHIYRFKVQMPVDSAVPAWLGLKATALTRLWLGQTSGQAVGNGFGLALAWLGPGHGLGRGLIN